MEVEPQAMDRDARIEARRQRIKERLGAQKGEGEGEGKTKVVEEESRSKAQISDSRARIDKLKTTGANEVTKVLPEDVAIEREFCMFLADDDSLADLEAQEEPAACQKVFAALGELLSDR